MVRRLLLAITDNRARTDISWGGVVQESSKGRPDGGCSFERSPEGGRDGGQGPSLSLEDGASKDCRAKRHLNVSLAEEEGREGARTLAMAVLEKVTIQVISVYWENSCCKEVELTTRQG